MFRTKKQGKIIETRFCAFHKRTMIKDRDGKYSCPECEFEFASGSWGEL